MSKQWDRELTPGPLQTQPKKVRTKKPELTPRPKAEVDKAKDRPRSVFYLCERCPVPRQTEITDQDYVPETVMCARCGNKIRARFNK